METTAVQVRIAARSIARHGLAHAYGHCSARLDDESFMVCPARPMGLVEPGEECPLVPVIGALPNGVLGEVRLHQRIYARRPEISGVVRFMSPHMMALAAMGLSPRPRHGFGAYFAPMPPLWNDPQLIRNDEAAEAVIDLMADNRAVLMRGNGAVVAGESLEEATVLAWYLEDACRIELATLRAGMGDTAPVLSAAEAIQRATSQGQIFERMWAFLTAGDPEI